MKSITVFDIPESKYNTVMEFLKGLQLKTEENNLQQWHIDLVDKRIEKYKKKPYPLSDANEVMDDIIKKL